MAYTTIDREKYKEMRESTEQPPVPEVAAAHERAVADLLDAARRIVTGANFTRCPHCGERSCADEIAALALRMKYVLEDCQRAPVACGAGRVGRPIDPPKILVLED